MMRSRLLAIVALIGLAAPVTGIAQSYMTPEDVFEQTDGAFLIPSGKRGAEWRANLESEMNIARHPSIIREPWDPVQDTGLPPPVALEDDNLAGFDDLPPVSQMPLYGGLDPTTARLLARLAQQNSILASTAAANGAPLAGTGPASVIAVLAMLGATVWTLRKARTLGRFV